MNISIFYGRGSGGICRGMQVGQAIGAKHNPKEGYENDLCIYAKKLPPHNFPKHSYLDINDAPRAIEFAKQHPDIGVIAISEVQKHHLEKVLSRKDIHLIPHHHCNYENWKRMDGPVETVGIIGSQNSFQYPIEDIRRQLQYLGLKLVYEEDYWNTYKKGRESVVEFYKGIDIQIAWRPTAWSPAYGPLRNPLKLSNAGSFGIPTVSYPEPDYDHEWKGCYAPASTIEKLLEEVKLLKENEVIYNVLSERAIENARKYHINNIRELYLKLP